MSIFILLVWIFFYNSFYKHFLTHSIELDKKNMDSDFGWSITVFRVFLICYANNWVLFYLLPTLAFGSPSNIYYLVPITDYLSILFVSLSAKSSFTLFELSEYERPNLKVYFHYFCACFVPIFNVIFSITYVLNRCRLTMDKVYKIVLVSYYLVSSYLVFLVYDRSILDTKQLIFSHPSRNMHNHTSFVFFSF